jgi:hypothetical protein
MSHYEDKPDDLIQDTKNFLKSEYGVYLTGIINEKIDGYLSSAMQPQLARPDLPLGSYRGIKEIEDLIKSPLDDDTPTRG